MNVCIRVCVIVISICIYVIVYIYIEREILFIIIITISWLAYTLVVVWLSRLSSCPAARPSLFFFLPLLYIIAPIILSLAELKLVHSRHSSFQHSSIIILLLVYFNFFACFFFAFCDGPSDFRWPFPP